MIDLKNYKGDEEDLHWELIELRNHVLKFQHKYQITEVENILDELVILINMAEPLH